MLLSNYASQVHLLEILWPYQEPMLTADMYFRIT